MTLGTPVISATTASIPEVAGDAAILVNPYDTREISEAIRAIDADDGLRDSLVQRGRARAELFSMDNSKSRLSAVYGKFI